MASENQQVALVVGASRGIGRQVAIDLAKNGYAGNDMYLLPFHLATDLTSFSSVVVAAKSTSDAYATKPFPPDPNSPQSTISTVAREIKEGGGQATAVAVDTRDFESVQKLVDETVKVSWLLQLARIFY